jgi:broad specificity phosphatase PhoE
VTDRLRLVLVRHGVTDWNREGRFQGHLDPPLSALGLEEARMVAHRLAADAPLRPRRIVTSVLVRASGTAAAIGELCGVEPEPDRRLIELGQGEWEGRTHDEIARHDAERYAVWRGSDTEPPGAETVADAMIRTGAVLDDLRAAAGTICLVSHGGTLRLVARQLLRLEAGRAWRMDLDNASISVVDAVDDGPGHGRWRLVRWNDTGHLLGRAPTHVDEVDGRPAAL